MMAEQDPYASIAKPLNADPYASIAKPPVTPPPAAQPSLLHRAMTTAGEGLAGIGAGAIHTLTGTDEWARKHLPAFMTNSNMGFGPPANLEHVKELATPPNTLPGKIGYGGEQVVEFMLPGGAEERGAAKLASFAPKLGRAAEPLAHIATSALSSGAINKAQGGDFSTGAAMGAGGQVLGQGLKAAAPMIASSALGIPKAAKAFGKTPGEAIINETRGIRPETIAASAQERLGQLNPQLEQAANAASVRSNPVRGLLSAPPQEIPLAAQSRNPRMRPMAFDAKVNPEEPLEPRSGNPLAPISEYPSVNPHYLSGSEHPELSGRVPTQQGVLIRPQNAPTGPPLASTVPNRIASLGPARSIIGNAMNSAEGQNAAGLHGQLGNMQEFLGKRFGTGEEIPANVTPRELLDLKRGLSEEHLRWNPEIHNKALSTGRQAYGALDQELDRTVPQAAGLNQRISSLIPVAQRAESVSRNAPTLQRALGRFGAHTGALTLGGVGAAGGYKEGGVPGAIAGGLTGVLAPELIASPEGQMIAARTLNKAGRLKPLVGGALQFNRKKEQQ